MFAQRRKSLLERLREHVGKPASPGGCPGMERLEKEGGNRSTVPSASVKPGEEPEVTATFHSAGTGDFHKQGGSF